MCVHRSSFAYLVCNKCLFEVLLPSYQVKVLILLWPWDEQGIFTRYRSLTLSVFQTILCIGLTSSLERSELYVLNNICFVLWLFAVRFCLLRLLWLSLWTHRNPWVRWFLLHKCKAARLQAVATSTVTIIIFFYKKTRLVLLYKNFKRFLKVYFTATAYCRFLIYPGCQHWNHKISMLHKHPFS